MIKKDRSIFKIKHNKKIEILDEEPKETSKSIFKKYSKSKIITFIISFIVLFLFIFSIITGKNIVLVGAKKVLNDLGIYTEEISSIEINSSIYNDEESWNINKSAKWTSSNTAEVVFDVNSIRKINDHKKDIILVIDVSKSMEGDKINKVISDTKELIDYVLTDTENRIALITFGKSSDILSPFTNDKDTLTEKLDSLELSDLTNYNAALKNVDTIMNGYTKEDKRDVVTLFLTDGFPNEDNPNQVGAYEVLKDKYPYMNINGIQYEMGAYLIYAIEEITDEQWVADQTTLNNVLFEATVSPLKYEEFTVNDYISDEFIVNSVKDIEVSTGEVELTEENGLQKIIWDLGNSKYVTGNNEKMTIKLTLKEEQTEEVLIPTNKKESITYKLEDNSEKTVNSSDTPVLKNMYELKYETNAPDGCELDDIPSEKHGIYTTVKKKTDELSCAGYLFKGWEMDDTDSIDTKSVGNDYFIMPEHDVTIRATWTKQSINKTMDGTVHEKTTLYKVLEKEAEIETYAKEYKYAHQDSMDESKSTKKIYYWEDLYNRTADIILNKNNVIFANQCWQMIRTTDTGGVKLLYNGEAENGKCLNTRGTHVGYSSATTKNLYTSYYYGTSYTYDTTTKKFTLSGNITTGSIEIGKYTCLSTSETETCTELNYVESLDSGTKYNVINLNGSSNYSQFGILRINKDGKSLSDVGYMYNTRYIPSYRDSPKEQVLDITLFRNDYYYADSVTYDESTGLYTLVNPNKFESSNYDDLTGKYTITVDSSGTSGYKVFYVAEANSTYLYGRNLTKGEIEVTDTYTYGDSYSANDDGTYTINNPITISLTEYGKNYSIVNNKYVCKNAVNNTCSELWYALNAGNEDFYYENSKKTYIYGNSFTYSNGTYKLKDTTTLTSMEIAADPSLLNNYHYTCFKDTGECTTLSYIYNYAEYNTSRYYLNLNNGKGIDDALKDMLYADDVNKYNSTIKSGVDAWYENTLLNYSDYLEDTIFCNYRDVSELNGFNPNGGSIQSSFMEFNNTSKRLKCTYETDKFSTLNEKAKLKYKVGLITTPEMMLLGSYDIKKTGVKYWHMSPANYRFDYAKNHNTRETGMIYPDNSYYNEGVRPTISLIPGIEYSSGDGSMDNPYVIDTDQEGE